MLFMLSSKCDKDYKYVAKNKIWGYLSCMYECPNNGVDWDTVPSLSGKHGSFIVRELTLSRMLISEFCTA